MEAFLAAARLGADMVELDARGAADGAVVVHHDPSVTGLGLICEHRASELPAAVPTLEAALETCIGSGLAVNVEVKNLPTEPDYDDQQRVARGVAELVAERGWANRVVVSSFALAAIDAVRALEPAIPTAWLTLAGWDQGAAIVTVHERGHRGLHPQDGAVSSELVAGCHEAELFLNTWTVDDPGRMRALVQLGVDGICTNVPDVLVTVLAG